jgi:MFS family permease
LLIHFTGLSILFVSYILGQIPSNLILNWFGRPSLYLGFFTIAWGLVSACTSQVTSFGGIVACRFLLGLVGTLNVQPAVCCC